MPVTSTFDTSGDTEGWSADTGASYGNNGNGYLMGWEPAPGTPGNWYFVAPSAYLGDMESYYGGTLSYDLIQFTQDNQITDAPDLELTGGGYTLVMDMGANPALGVAGNYDWTRYSIDLEVGYGWRLDTLDGAFASEAQIRAVLADLQSLRIRGEFVVGQTGDTTFLDNVALTEGALLRGSGYGPRVWSSFNSENSFDGWSFTGDVGDFHHVASGGYSGTSDGYLEAVDAGLGPLWYFMAPGRYLGDKGFFYGGTMSFALKQSDTTSPLDGDDVILSGGGLTIVLDIAAPGTDWTSYSFAMDTSADWRIGSETGAVASEAQIRAVLGDLQQILIRGEYRSGADTGGLDEFFISAPWNVHSGIDYQTLEQALFNSSAGATIVIGADEIASTTNIGTPIEIALEGATITAPAGYDAQWQMTGIATLSASAPGVTIFGNDLDNEITGGGTVFAGAGDDLLVADAAAVYGQYSGEAGNDTLIGSDTGDFLQGGDGNDVVQGGLGNDSLLGGDGFDMVDYSERTADVLVNLNYNLMQTGGATEESFYEFEGTTGGAGNDTLVGNAAGNVLNGGGGDDQIYGLAGADILRGDAGDDTIEGSGGNDTMQGGGGLDALSYYNAAGAVTVNLAYQGAAQDVGGSAGIDVFYGFETLLGSRAYGDTLIGDAGGNAIYGYDGADTLYGAAGNDSLYGMQGDDMLAGGGGADRLVGGVGSDTFAFNAVGESTSAARDTIVDFGGASGGGDVDAISLVAIDADTGTAGDQAFSFIGGAAFTGTAGELRFVTNGTDGFVLGDVNGDGVQDLEIRLLGITAMDAGDFIL